MCFFYCFARPCGGQGCCCYPACPVILNQPVQCGRNCFFLEMVLCPEVLALIVATALLSKHHGTQRERNQNSGGEARAHRSGTAKSRATHCLPCLRLTIELRFLPSVLLESKERSYVQQAENCRQTFCKYKQIIIFIFLKRLRLKRESKSYPRILPCSANLLTAVCKCSKDSEPDSLLPVPV